MAVRVDPYNQVSFACETCMTRMRSEANPHSLIARFWRWHTGWCPAWKAYQAYLADQRTGREPV